MPFTFKLSVRLALMKASCVLALAVMCATCELNRRVTDPNPHLVQVLTSPSTVTLDPYQSQQFLAFGRTDAGDSVAVAVGWSATGGTVTADGFYTAGAAPGAYRLIATQSGGTMADTSTVTVMAPPPPPPPPQPPPGVLIQEGFEDAALASRGWYDNTSAVVTTAQHTPNSTRALELHFTSGASVPVAGGALRHLFAATPTLYVSYWVKYSSNWVGSGRPYHPHEFYVLSNLDGDWDGPANNWLTVYIEHNYQNGGYPRLAMQDNKAINTSFGAPPINLVGITENRSTGGCNGIVEQNMPSECYNAPPWYNDKQLQASQVWFQPTAGAGYKGNWNHVEAYVQMNSVVGGVGVADGVMQYWFNGTLVIDRHDILFRTGVRPTLQFHQFLIAAYIGDGSPVDQYMWVDDLTVATNKP